MAFYMSSISIINYLGTKKQWNTITKGTNWDKVAPSNLVINYLGEAS
jgi:hypothetical protein